MQTLQKLALTLAFLVLPGCGGDSTPDDAMAKKAFEEQLAEKSGGKLKLVGFEKRDAMQGEMFGVLMYSVEFDGELEFQEDGRWMVGGAHSGFELGATDSFVGEPVARGDKRKFVGDIEFSKHESGWRAEKAHIDAPE